MAETTFHLHMKLIRQITKREREREYFARHRNQAFNKGEISKSIQTNITEQIS